MMPKRRRSRQVRIGDVRVGGAAPVSIQSMTKTATSGPSAVIAEIKALRAAGCEIVRLAVKNNEDLSVLKKIKKAAKIPIVADIHFNYKLALGAIDRGVDAVRLNPGNIRKPDEIRDIVKSAKEHRIPVRIGINSGSLRKIKGAAEDDAMVAAALDYAKHFERLNFRDMIISLKSSDVLSTVSAYKKIAVSCDYPLHVGVTATGPGEDGVIKSAVGIGSLLSCGIGDTIRVSLTSGPVDEVNAAKRILQALRLRNFGPDIISCPTCGRCQTDIEGVAKKLQERLCAKRYTLNAKTPISIAVMGCEVNGPGEAREADIGIAAGKSSGVLFKKGRIVKRIKEKDFLKEIVKNI